MSVYESLRKARGEASSKSKSATQETTSAGAREGGVLPDFEQVLAEITQLIEKRLADQDELATDLSGAIEEIFKEHGLLVTA
jgi:hypothetical protein